MDETKFEMAVIAAGKSDEKATLLPISYHDLRNEAEKEVGIF